MTPVDPTITREVAPIPRRSDDAHKGDVGRVVIIGGCCGDVTMIGAPALAGNAALRTGAGLVQLMVPKAIVPSVGVLAPCATMRSLATNVDSVLDAIQDFSADLIVLGPGLGDSLTAEQVAEVAARFSGPVVLDADALNLLAASPPNEMPSADRIVMTPHPGEARRLLSARGVDLAIENSPASRRTAVCALVEAYGCTVVLKGRGTIVANRERLYVNQTGNAGMATAGAGDVLTGVIAAWMGQGLDPLEAAILAVHLHGLAGDFAAEELGRCSMIATDIIEYLPEAICEHDMSASH